MRLRETCGYTQPFVRHVALGREEERGREGEEGRGERGRKGEEVEQEATGSGNKYDYEMLHLRVSVVVSNSTAVSCTNY